MVLSILRSLLVIAALAAFPAIAQQQQKVESFEEVELRRSVCFGSCPEYSIIVRKDGTVLYEGNSHVDTVGKRRSKIATADVSFLITALNEVSFLSLRDRYASEEDGCKGVWTDNPYLTIRLKSQTLSKSVKYYLGCREAKDLAGIKWLANTIDFLAGTRTWIDVD